MGKTNPRTKYSFRHYLLVHDLIELFVLIVILVVLLHRIL